MTSVSFVSDAPPIRPMRVVAWCTVIGVALAALALFPAAIMTVLIAFAGIILGVYLRGLTEFFARRVPLPRVSLLLAVIFAHVAVITLFLAWATPLITAELQDASGEIAASWDELVVMMSDTWLGGVVERIPPPERILQSFPDLTARLMGLFSNTLFGLIALLIIVFVGMYLAWAPRSYLTGLLLLVPPERRERASEVLDELYFTLRRWVAGRTISAAIIGVGTGLGVWALGVPLALPLAVLAGVLSYIPNIGPVLTLVPASLLALPQGWQVSVGVVAIYTAVQFVESYLLEPIIERWSVRVPPAVLIVMQALLGVLLGFFGVALASPIVAVLMVVVRRLYVEDRLGEESAPPGEAAEAARKPAPQGEPAPA